MSASVFERICELLKGAGADFSVIEHAPVFTSEEAAAVRGTSLASGAKALVCRAGGAFRMFVLPANRRLDNRALRTAYGWRDVRFASKEEVFELTGLAPGAIPPLGSLFGLPTICDRLLIELQSINFNAGDHAKSVCLAAADYVRIEQPTIGHVSKPG